MPDRMSNRMSEDMSDRMPEDLPVRKCINVMVGITRSKVIFEIAMERSTMLLRTVNHLFLWAIYTMAMLNNQLVCGGRYHNNHEGFNHSEPNDWMFNLHGSTKSNWDVVYGLVYANKI